MSDRDYHWGGIVRPDMPFHSWLKRTKKLQEDAFGHNFDDWSDDDLVQWVIINTVAAEDELHEALAEISWKPWASSTFFNREAFLGEIVDALHFIGNLCVGARVTDDELNAAYLDKNKRNKKRQQQGYTGTHKCTGCGRAIDDVIAHGGTVLVSASGYWCVSCEGE